MRIIAIAAVAAFGLSFGMAGGAEARCVMASAKGMGPGTHAAGEQARQALREGLQVKNWKGRGRVTTKCEANMPLTTCTASQRACS